MAAMVNCEGHNDGQKTKSFLQATGLLDKLNEGDARTWASLAIVITLQKVARWMSDRGYATGHGDTIEDLLRELDWQIEERIKNAKGK